MKLLSGWVKQCFPITDGEGFHPTGTCGTFGTSAVATKLLKLPKEAIASAFGFAGTQAAALREGVGVGSYTMKKMHPGKAAHNGILAAFLATEGLEAPWTILEGKAGFLNLFSEQYKRDLLLDGLGKSFLLDGSYIKPYASVRHAHSPIDSILQLRRMHNLKPDDVAMITVKSYKEGLMTWAKPDSSTEAQFSIPYNIAVALYDGEVTLKQFSDDRIKDPNIRALTQKISLVFDQEMDDEYVKTKKRAQIVEVKTKNGNLISLRTDYPKEPRRTR